jgi:hypothetical protein
MIIWIPQGHEAAKSSEWLNATAERLAGTGVQIVG